MIDRPAERTDVPAIARILAANHEPMDWPDMPDLGTPYLEHLVDRARVHVAEDDAGTLIAFGGSIPVGRDDIRFLTDLFVHPDWQGKGAGGRLLRALLEGTTERMTVASGDHRALGLYLRAGMRAWWPLLYLQMPAGRLPVPDPAYTVHPADVEETVHVSARWTGVDRTIDFEHYASLPEARGFSIRRGADVVAVGWARRERKRNDGRWLDHASLGPTADPVGVGIAVLTAAAEEGGLTAPIPGPHPALPELLRAGARIAGRDMFCATDPRLIDPVRLLPNPGFL